MFKALELKYGENARGCTICQIFVIKYPYRRGSGKVDFSCSNVLTGLDGGNSDTDTGHEYENEHPAKGAIFVRAVTVKPGRLCVRNRSPIELD